MLQINRQNFLCNPLLTNSSFSKSYIVMHSYNNDSDDDDDGYIHVL